MKMSTIASIKQDSQGNRFANAISRITPRSPIWLRRAVCNWHNGEFTPIEYCSLARGNVIRGDIPVILSRSSLTLSGINVTARHSGSSVETMILDNVSSNGTISVTISHPSVIICQLGIR